MPKVPGYEPNQVGLTTQGGPGTIGAKASPEDFGAGFGQGMKQLGGVIQRAQEEAFQLRRDSINSDLRTAAQKRLSHIQTIKGQAAADPTIRKGKTLSDEGDEELRVVYDKLIGDKRLSARQREVLENDFKVQQATLRASTDAHTQRELNTWKEGEHQRKVTGIVQDVQLLVEPGMTPVAQGLLQVFEAQLVSAAEQEAQRTGGDAEHAKLLARSVVSRTAVEALFDKGKFTEAKALFDEMAQAKKFAPKDYDALKKAVDGGAAVSAGNALAIDLNDRIDSGEITEAEAEKLIAKHPNPNESEQAHRQLARLRSATAQAKKAEVEDVADGVVRMMVRGDAMASVVSSPGFVKLTELDPPYALRVKNAMEVDQRQKEAGSGGRRLTPRDYMKDYELRAKFSDIVSTQPLANMQPKEVAVLAAELGPYGTQLFKLYDAATKKTAVWKPADALLDKYLLSSPTYRDKKGALNAAGKEAKAAISIQLTDDWASTGKVVEPDPKWIADRVQGLTREYVTSKGGWFSSDKKNPMFKLRASLGDLSEADSPSAGRADLMRLVSPKFHRDAVAHLEQIGRVAGRSKGEIEWAVGKMWLDSLAAGTLKPEDTNQD